MSSHKCLIYNASVIVQVAAKGERFLRGNDDKMKDLPVLSNSNKAESLSIVAIDGIIDFIGLQTDQEFVQKFKNIKFETSIDATGCSVLPGFVDSHTHPVWEGDRINEFKMKLGGATYMEVHNAGGGINFTVEKCKEASEEKLYGSLVKRLEQFTKAGTTFAECKSGYGLEWETELKLLRVLTKAKRSLTSIGMTNTYLAAHSVPKGKTSDEATDDILNNQLPSLKALIASKELDVDTIDVFCEKDVFDVAQSEKMLAKGQQDLGLNINFHSDELFPLNSVEMGVRLKAKGVSHLEEMSDHEIALLAKSETVGILLPTTAFVMRLKRPPGRKMLDAGCIVALGSDFNPNAYCFSMPYCMSLACIDMKLTINEMLVAATLNSAFALGVEKTKGSIEVGKSADLVLLNTDRWENIVYQLGAAHTLIKSVLVNGQVVSQ